MQAQMTYAEAIENLAELAEETERLREVAAAAKAIIDYADSKGWAIAVVERKPGDDDGELSKRLRLALSKVPNGQGVGPASGGPAPTVWHG